LLNKPLMNLGISNAFNSVKSDFSKISVVNGVYISRVFHKTFIDLNENGTEAAAVTAVQGGIESPPTPKNFIANKPFVYAITEKSTGCVIFIGKLMDPSVKSWDLQ
jgi:serpin B